jgi:hypothetical protein
MTYSRCQQRKLKQFALGLAVSLSNSSCDLYWIRGINFPLTNTMDW